MFLLIALAAGGITFTSIAGQMAAMARTLCAIFLFLSVFTLLTASGLVTV